MSSRQRWATATLICIGGILSGCGQSSEPESIGPATVNLNTDPSRERVVNADHLPPQSEPPISASADGIAASDDSGVPRPLAYEAFDRLSHAYASGDEGQWSAAEETLLKLDAEAVPALIDALTAGPTHEREIAAAVLAQIPPDSVIDPDLTAEFISALTDSLDDESILVQARCVQALCDAGVPPVKLTPTMRRLFRSQDAEILTIAATVAGDLGPAARSLVPELSELKRHDDKILADAATTALSRIGTEKVSEAPPGSRRK